MNIASDSENQGLTCQTTGLDVFSPENLSRCIEHVRGIQRKLDKAVANGDKNQIRWFVHLLSKKSKAVKILAVHRICEVNSGKHTAGVDGIAMPRDKGERHTMMIQLLNTIDITDTPSPIKRVFIPKPNGKKRPLGIPTIKDRIIQEIIRQSIEPICESHFNPCSHGFRPKRCCQDAIEDLFIKLARKNARRWIVEGDIEGCFDHIKHDHIISTLTKWGVPIPITDIIKAMLKADIMKDLSLTPSYEGTPQGGVISPMLANVALTALDKEVMERFGTQMNPIVRYADDFVVVALSERHAKSIKSHIKEHLKAIGLTLSDEKTHITEISKGFDFLGFNIRKYQDKLLIKPTKENVQRVLSKMREIIKTSSHLTTTALVSKLNPIIRGWGNYYRFVISSQTFTHIDDKVWQMIRQWVRAKHSRLSPNLKERYFGRIGGSNQWVLRDKDTGAYLQKMKSIRIKRFVKVRNDKRVYDANDIKYWQRREYQNAMNSIYGSVTHMKLFKKQKGRCEWCSQHITDKQLQETKTHLHHVRPRSESGDNKLGNLRLVHADCHNSLHSRFSP